MTPDEVNHSQAGNVIMLGIGGIFGMWEAGSGSLRTLPG